LNGNEKLMMEYEQLAKANILSTDIGDLAYAISSLKNKESAPSFRITEAMRYLFRVPGEHETYTAYLEDVCAAILERVEKRKEELEAKLKAL